MADHTLGDMTLPANKTEYNCCECGVHVSSCVPSPIHPYCGLCVWRPGWWRSAELRKQFAHDEQWRNELALRAELEAAE
jgi:hypothetical protein